MPLLLNSQIERLTTIDDTQILCANLKNWSKLQLLQLWRWLFKRLLC